MKSNIKLSIFWITSFIIIIFIMAFRVHAEESYDYFPMEQNENGLFSESNLAWIDTLLDKDNNYIFVKYIDGSASQIRCNYLIMPKSVGDVQIFGEISNNLQNFSLYRIGSGSYSVGMLTLKTNGTYTNTPLTTNFSVFQNLPSSKYSNLVCYASNFKIYTSNLENAALILKYGPDPITPIDIGVAIVPPEPILPDYPSGTTPPSQVPPTYTSSDYNWTTPPTFDNSSVTNAIGSIQNTLGWIANNLKEEFKNLTNNLKGFFKYIGDTIQYYGNALLSTLNNFIQNFYDNMKSLVEPIFQKLDYITTPLESDIIWDNISGTSLITNYSSIINAASSLKSSFENLSEPTEYKIPIHLENISTFGTLTTQYIDLSVINPVKQIIRTFMWALITYSLVVTIIDSIANYINGGGDES